MRLRNSVALPSADQLVLAAICSAEDTIRGSLSYDNAASGCFPAQAASKGKLEDYVSGRRPAHNLLFSGLRCCDREFAPGFLDGVDGRLGGAGHGDVEFRGHLALGQNAHTVELTPHQARGHEHILSDLGSAVDLARLDEFLDQAEVHHRKGLAVRLVEAALGQTLVERHLAALVALDGHTRAGFLTLDTTATHLAHARARATADAFLALGRAVIVTKFVQFHCRYLLAGCGPQRREWPTTALLVDDGPRATGGV